MAKIIEFPHPAAPDYNGRVVMLDRAKANRFQCRGLNLGMRNQMAVVPSDASMPMIRKAIEDGILIDLTEHPEIWEQAKAKELAVDESDVGKKSFTATRQFFRDLGIDPDPEASGDEMVCYCTADADEQKRIEQAIPKALQPAVAGQPVQLPSGLFVPPGMDNPDKYLLR